MLKNNIKKSITIIIALISLISLSTISPFLTTTNAANLNVKSSSISKSNLMLTNNKC